MNSVVNIELIYKRFEETQYFSQVLIPHLHETIHEIKCKQNVLVELFHNQFYEELYTQIESKHALFKVYLKDIIEMKEAFYQYIQTEEKTTLTEEEAQIESLLVNAVSEIQILLDRLEIEMINILNKLEKQDENLDKDIQDTNKSDLLNY
jgi:hypothetical protein